MSFPQTFRTKTDLIQHLTKLQGTFTQLIKHGLYAVDNAMDMRQFVVELQRKIDRGTPFQQWFYGQERHHDIRNFTAWLVRAREYGALLPDGLGKHKAAAEAQSSAEERWSEEEWCGGWDCENGDWY